MKKPQFKPVQSSIKAAISSKRLVKIDWKV